MVASQEFPELTFVPARAFGTGRDGRKVKLSVIHYTAGSERSTSAEDGAAYDQRRTGGTSCHLFHDQNSSVQTVYRWNRANSAFYKGNRLGVHHELCGTQQTRAQWLDPASDGTLWQAARYVADDCLTYNLQPRRLSVAETRATWYSGGPGGICGHVDITKAFPEDGGTHTDPGDAFPWDVLLSRVHLFMIGDAMALTDAQFTTLLQAAKNADNALYHALIGDDEIVGNKSVDNGAPVVFPNILKQILIAASAPAVIDPVAFAQELAGNQAFIGALASAVAEELADPADQKQVAKDGALAAAKVIADAIAQIP